MQVDATHLSGAVYIRVAEPLDGATVDRIEAWLGTSGRRVVLDFHDTQTLQPDAMTRLADVLQQTTCPVVLRGLSAHHYRLLRYIGVPQEGGSERAMRGGSVVARAFRKT
jgi:hypothetical protein